MSNCAATNTKLLGKKALRAFARNVAVPDFFDLFGGQLMAGMLLAARGIVTFAYVEVARVFALCSQIKMRWVNAWRVVAFMKDAKTIWNRAIVDTPRCAMSANVLPTWPTFANHAIAGAKPPPFPFPASFGFLETPDETNFERNDGTIRLH